MLQKRILLCVGWFLPLLLLAQAERLDLFETASLPPPIDFRSNCTNTKAQAEQNINNVRARLLLGGDMWWDGNSAQYIVPKPPPGEQGISSIFAAGLWLGGRSPGGELKMAAQQYGRSNGRFDFYAGPLSENGTTSIDTCSYWDQLFEVRSREVVDFISAFQAAEAAGIRLDTAQIPRNLLGWPAQGNPHFAAIHGFNLPNTTLATFWDYNVDGRYDPLDGDYPHVRMPCFTTVLPDQLFFSIFNDAGNNHNSTNTPSAMRMEVQAYSFAFQTDDDLNNTTFQQYRFKGYNREDILATYFGLWVDTELGCYADDRIGVDSSLSLVYVYNEDELDGTNGVVCDGGNPTYGDEIPILGITLLEGPKYELYDEQGQIIEEAEYYGFTSFVPFPLPAELPLDQRFGANSVYNILQGLWPDGRPIEYGGTGYNQGTTPTKFPFSSDPNDPDGWSMCTENIIGDGMVMSIGPFTMQPGSIKRLSTAVLWVPDQVHPCPSLDRLREADKFVGSQYFDCFSDYSIAGPVAPKPDTLRGPDAPSIDWVELDGEVIALFSNAPTSNNYLEQYTERDPCIPESVADSMYRFEGYLLYQLANPTVSLEDRDDPEKVRLVAQMDIQNGVDRLFNWLLVPPFDPSDTSQYVYMSELMVDGRDEGIRRALRINRDAFSDSDAPLINHRHYYFVAVAYAYNNYSTFNPRNIVFPGQPNQYIEGQNNLGDVAAGEAYYRVIPRPTLDQELASQFGTSPAITRLAGRGNGGIFLKMDSLSRQNIRAAYAAGADYQGAISYEAAAGPLDIQIVNPLEVLDGQYELRFYDNDPSDSVYVSPVTWTLGCVEDCGVSVIVGERPLEESNDQIIPEFGFSVFLKQVAAPGSSGRGANGAIGASLVYEDLEGEQWLSFLPDDYRLNIAGVSHRFFDYVHTDPFVNFQQLDGDGELGRIFSGVVPYALLGSSERSFPYLSPVWRNASNKAANRRMSLGELRSVDIVFTADKNLWSRCPVVETRYEGYPLPPSVDPALANTRPPNMLEMRAARSVSKEAGPDGLPVVDMVTEPIIANGMGWFPGYAVDVETGQRLQIFWGENSVFDGRTLASTNQPLAANGGDMIWNPSSLLWWPIGGLPADSYLNFPAGGQHFVYVTNAPYDGGTELEVGLRRRATAAPSIMLPAITKISWVLFPQLSPGSSLLSYAEGIIPNEARLSIRVDSPYDWAAGIDEYQGHGTYRFELSANQARPLDRVARVAALEEVNIVPNPYYGTSIYESYVPNKVVKITNLPARCELSIFTLDGKLVRRFSRNEQPMFTTSDSARRKEQLSPALEWDMTNSRGAYIGSGVYLIHVDAFEQGERTLKFFCANQASGLSGG